MGLPGSGNREQAVIDVEGRSIYLINRYLKALVRYSIRRGSVDVIPLPRQARPPQDMDLETYLAFDPINRVVLYPNSYENSGRMYGLGIYHVDSKKWEWEAVPPGPPFVQGNVLAFEIGCGGTVLKLTGAGRPVAVTWVVFSAAGPRAREARESAEIFLEGAKHREVIVNGFRDGFFPSQSAEIKEWFEALKPRVDPDLVLTHYRGDRHQDHRLISELTWNTFRRHLILEYEIPKYDGDFGSPNVFVELDEARARRKAQTILDLFRTQAARRWFSEDLFLAVLRLRGMECAAPGRLAEAFYCHKGVLGW